MNGRGRGRAGRGTAGLKAGKDRARALQPSEALQVAKKGLGTQRPREGLQRPPQTERFDWHGGGQLVLVPLSFKGTDDGDPETKMDRVCLMCTHSMVWFGVSDGRRLWWYILPNGCGAQGKSPLDIRRLLWWPLHIRDIIVGDEI